ncbi:unnamed protein product [Camellia sinensis]
MQLSTKRSSRLVSNGPLIYVRKWTSHSLSNMSMAYTSTSSSNDGRLFENRRCKCEKKAAVKISNSVKNPGRLYFKCADGKCDFFAWWAPTSQHGNAADIQWRPNPSQRNNEDDWKNDAERNYEALDKLERRLERRLEQLEANVGTMKFLTMASIVCTGFNMLMLVICLMLK